MRVRPRTSPHITRLQPPTLIEEYSLASRGFCRIAGVDEAGRGSWAGPLVAAAVCLPSPQAGLLLTLEGVRDSKQLTPARRDRLYEVVLECAVDVGVGVVSAATIDRVGLSRAGQMAMLWAVEDMARPPDSLLLDAFTIRGCTLHQRAIVHGDALSLSIAAASIIAKVSRDRLMRAVDALYPGYGFRENKGYGTGEHRKSLEALGPCGLHRLSYQPVRCQMELLL